MTQWLREACVSTRDTAGFEFGLFLNRSVDDSAHIVGFDSFNLVERFLDSVLRSL